MKCCAIARRTTLFSVFCLTVFSFTLFTGSAMGQPPILGPGDTAIAIDVDLGMVTSGFPAAENPPKLIDGDPAAGDPPMPSPHQIPQHVGSRFRFYRHARVGFAG